MMDDAAVSIAHHSCALPLRPAVRNGKSARLPCRSSSPQACRQDHQNSLSDSPLFFLSIFFQFFLAQPARFTSLPKTQSVFSHDCQKNKHHPHTGSRDCHHCAHHAHLARSRSPATSYQVLAANMGDRWWLDDDLHRSRHCALITTSGHRFQRIRQRWERYGYRHFQ